MVTVRAASQIMRERFFPALTHRDFRFMWFGHVAGESASWTLGIAEVWLVFSPNPPKDRDGRREDSGRG